MRIARAKSVSDPSLRVEAAKARAEFQRDVFKVRDARIAAADGLGTTVTATATAIATVATAVLVNGGASMGWIVALIGMAFFTVLASLVSRAEKPWPRTQELSDRLLAAKAAVDAFHAASPNEGPEAMHNLAFNSWWALTYSAQGRERLKRKYNVLAVMGLFAEVAVAVLGMYETSA
jgi:hypothetical protein